LIPSPVHQEYFRFQLSNRMLSEDRGTCSLHNLKFEISSLK